VFPRNRDKPVNLGRRFVRNELGLGMFASKAQ
jgi:hypothetical protein